MLFYMAMTRQSRWTQYNHGVHEWGWQERKEVMRTGVAPAWNKVCIQPNMAEFEDGGWG